MEAGRFVNLCGSTLIAVGTAEFSVCVQVYVCIHICVHTYMQACSGSCACVFHGILS